MKKSIMASAAALAVCAMALAAAAQQERNVTTSKDKADTVKINVSGRIELDYVWRSPELTRYTASMYNGLGAPTANPEGENTFEGVAAIRVDAELSDKVSAVLEVGTLRVAPVGNLVSGINYMGTAIGGLVGMREAQIKLNEFLMPELAVKAGIMDWAFDVRGKGNGFVFDPRHSQGFTRNVGNGTTQEAADTVMARGGSPSEQYPVGGVVSYKRDALQLDLVLMPAVQEYGAFCQDENLYALDFWYNLEQVGKGSRIGLIGAITGTGPIPGTVNVNQNHCEVYTIGGGVELKGLGGQDGLEIYGEIYKQFGKIAESIDIAGQSEDIDAKGMAFQVGAEFHFNDPMGAWVGINYTYFSGDGDDDLTDTETNRFLSYENVSDLLIVEDMYFGLDIDTNYTALKFSGGVALSVGTGKNNLELSVIVGLCNMQEDVVATAGDTTKKLGTEFDVKGRWHLSKQASLSAAFAMLTSSDVLEEAMLLDGVPSDDAEDKAYLYTLGLDVKF